MNGVTSGLTVVELGDHIASSYCTKLLADYGSDVLKVEWPDGGPLRAAGPFRDDEPSIEGGGLFTFLNTSKRSVVIDWRTADGRELVDRLLKQSDIVVHPFGGEERAAFGLGSEARDQRGLIEVAVTPYGLDGPYAEFESEPITMAALSGWMFCMGDHDKPPLFPGGPYTEYLSGLSAAAGALIAIAARMRTGAGQVVDVSELEVGVEALPFDPLRFSYSGTYRSRTDERYGDSPTSAIYPCADGFVQFQEEWRTAELLRILGGDELADDERFRTKESRLLNRDALRQALLGHLATRGRWELFEQCGRDRIISSAVPDMADLLRLKPHEERKYFHPLTKGALQGVPLPGPPIRFGAGEWRCEPAPSLGSANPEALGARPGPPPRRPTRSGRMPQMGQPGPGALEGVRVIEIAQGWAGPLVGAMLADFGAEVIKVESIQRLDWWRRSGALAHDPLAYERSALFNGINRNKRDVTLNLQRPEGRSLLLRLVQEADVFVENFTSHVVEQLALTHEVLAAANPAVISVSMPAYGSGGPWRDYPALGTTVESMCGVQSLTGYEGGPPRFQGTSWDPVIGLYASFAVMAALHHRRRTGRGQHVEVSHIEAGTHLVAGPLLEYLLTGRTPRRMGNASGVFAPHGCYPARGSGEWITLVSRSDAQWEAVVRVLGDDPSLHSPEYATLQQRVAHREALDAALAPLTARRDARELFRELQAAGVAAAPVSTPPALLEDEHLAARGFWTEVERQHVGTHLYPSRFMTMSRTPPTYARPAPTLGQDNDLVLADRLGLSKTAMAALERRGIIGTSPAPSA